MLRSVFASIGLVIANLLLETVVFAKVNLYGIRPDTIIPVIVAISLTFGGMRGGLYGFCCGILIDILFSKFIGMYALPYMLIGVLTGFFFNKYFANNKLFPMLIAMLAYGLKEALVALQLKMMGVDFTLGDTLLTYFIPCAVLTAGLAALIYSIYRRQREQYLRRARHRQGG